MPKSTKIALDSATQKNVDAWLNGHYDDETKAEIRKMLQEDPKEVSDAFYTTLSFGTAGMRGIMGVGSNRMNRYNIRAATQALANYLHKQKAPPEGHSVLIGYDSRHHSREFAEEIAKVLAGNNIKALLFKELRPTPLVSFGCRFKHCSAAVMVTASHNPPEYNGYKVYWNDGGQVLPPHDKGIMAEYAAITDVNMVKSVNSLQHPMIEHVLDEIDQAYLKTIAKLQNYPQENHAHGKDLKVVYANLHGTGITLMPRALVEWGFPNLVLVKPQDHPDGDFPTALPPNPEEHSAMRLGIETLEKNKGDILIATDPDADRVAVGVQHKGKTVLLNGNQIASICIHHICEALTAQKKMPPRAAFVKNLGTTELFRVIAESYGKTCVSVLIGFKYIAGKIREWEQDLHGFQYVFGGEESYGYLLGTQSRDKDAILAGALLCEIASHAKQQGKTLVDVLNEIYQKYGLYFEELFSLNFEESQAGKEQMVKGMARLRSAPPKEIAGYAVASVEDYQTSIRTDLKTGKTDPLMLPKSDVLLFWLADGSKAMVRPSGTEPKIKFYCGIVNKGPGTLEEKTKECKQRADRILAFLKEKLTT